LTNKTAILIFANSAKAEGLNKPFQKSAVLFQALNTEIEAKVKQTQLPYFLVSEKQQIGSTFGERFTNAIQSVFNKGFDNIITVGNDTPHLKANHINKAYKKLKTDSLVLGPSQDGGFYLMGISKKLFDAKNFINLPWQTSKLRERIINLLSFKKVNVSILETLNDIDTVSDAKTLSERFRSVSTLIKSILLLIITSAKAKTIHLFQFLKLNLISSNYNKGSPFIFSV